jgi:DNA-binding winged helix-turn-helix (wHTH) protein
MESEKKSEKHAPNVGLGRRAKLAFPSRFPQNRSMRFSFAELVFDSRLHHLSRDGQPVELSPKAYTLLEILLEARPAAVSKEALYDRLWPKTFVEPGNLHNLISEIRSALGDEARAMIRTVHGFGYAFAAEGSTTLTPASFAVRFGGELLPLHVGENIIGRDPEAAVVIDAPDVSRHHARLLVSNDTVTLEDLGSKNGTFVDGKRLTSSMVVCDGDLVTVGRTLFRIERLLDAPSTATAP